MSDTDFDFNKFNEGIKENNKDGGWSVIGVGSGPGGWTYTVGLSQHNHPEILCLGLPHKLAGAVLNDLGKRVKAGQRPPIDEPIMDALEGGFPVKLVRVPRDGLGHYTRAAEAHYPGCEILQMVWPDPNGKLPDDPECMDEYVLAQAMVAEEGN